MVYKSVADVEAALAVKLPEAMTEKNYDGFTTVSWTAAARVLDQVFGPFGWSDRVVSSHSDGERGVYTVTRELTVHACDEQGAVLSKTVTGVGTSVAQAARGSSELTPKAHKTAAMGAASIAFSKATKLLGDAFGLYLYDGDESTPTQSAAPRAARPTASSGGGSLSEKQEYVLKQAGFDAQTIASLSRQQGSDLISLYMNGGRKPLVVKGKVSAKAQTILAGEGADDDDEDGVPF